MSNARRGRFGRLPRSQPDLTSTIVAIAREMAAQVDRNIVDAWKNGGTIDGRPVTDEMLLAHWRGRLKDVDPGDPQYDTLKNTVLQFEYSIAESKASTAYAQGRLSDAGMAQFYLNWARKVPKNSEFYRSLQRDAAQFMRASRARGRASAAKAKDDAYAQAQERDYNRYEKPGEYITGVLRNMAKANALIGAGDTDLTEFDVNDPGRMLALLNTLNGDAQLYRDGITGEVVTAASVRDALKRLDPNFDGRVNLDYVRGLVRQQLRGQGIRLERAEEAGKKGDANNLRKWQEYTGEIGREMALWPVQEGYNSIRSAFLRTWMSPTTTPDEKLAAWERYSSGLTKLAAGKDVDDNTRSRLMAEATGDGSVKSLAEDFTGLESADNTTPTGEYRGDIAETVFDVQRYVAMREAVAAGQAVWTTGVTDNTGVFRPTPGGPEVGAAAIQDIQAASLVPPVIVIAPQAGARSIPLVVTGVSITAKARNELGQPLDRTDDNPIGVAYDVFIGGQRTRVYGYVGADGRTLYTSDTPWDDTTVRARETNAGGRTWTGIELDVSALVPRKDESGNWVYANGDPANVSGEGAFGLSAPNQQGQQRLVFNPARAVYLSDPARAAAGPDPMTDSFSPTIAALISSAEGRRVLQEAKNDPVFKAQIALEAQRAATDPTTGQVDAGLLARYNLEVQIMQDPSLVRDFVGGVMRGARDLWNRASTLTTFRATEDNRRPEVVSLEARDERAAAAARKPLPSDEARRTSFAPLADIFNRGSTTLVRPGDTRSEAAGIALQVAGTIKVPRPPTAPQVSPKPVPAPAPSPTAAVPAPPDVTVRPAPTIAPPPPSPAVNPYTGFVVPPSRGIPAPRYNRLKYL